jgi:hypothetical protein
MRVGKIRFSLEDNSFWKSCRMKKEPSPYGGVLAGMEATPTDSVSEPERGFPESYWGKETDAEEMELWRDLKLR